MTPTKEQEELALRIVMESFWDVWLNAKEKGWLDAGLSAEQVARAMHTGVLKALKEIIK